MAVFNLNLPTNPAPLGFLEPTAGTPLSVLANFTGGITGPSLFSSKSFQAHPSNSGLIYVLNSSSAADTTNGTNILAVLSAGQSITFTSQAVGLISPKNYWIDTSVTGSICIPSVLQ